MADRGPAWAAYVDALPRRISELCAEWQLTEDNAPMHGYCAVVLPVRTAGRRPAVLKVAFPDDDPEHSHLALPHRHGPGAVQLPATDPPRPPRPLSPPTHR